MYNTVVYNITNTVSKSVGAVSMKKLIKQNLGELMLVLSSLSYLVSQVVSCRHAHIILTASTLQLI